MFFWQLLFCCVQKLDIIGREEDCGEKNTAGAQAFAWISGKEEAGMVKINGESRDVDGMSIQDFLKQENYKTERIVVERNMEIVPKPDYASTKMEDGDEIEIVSFVGGG